MLMRSLNSLICLLIITLIAGSCGTSNKLSDSKSIITPLSGNINISESSIVYGLPLTVLDINIEAERIIEKPGPYSRYAEELLGLTDIVKTESEHWSIKQVTISSHEELDPSEFYLIEGSTLFQTNVLALKKAGLIMDLNPEIYNSAMNYNQVREGDRSQALFFDLGSDEYFQDRRDTIYKVVSVDTAFIKIPYLVEKKQKLTVDQLAEKAAVRLMELRDGKHMILTGETNIFPQNRAAIDEMNRIEKDYTDLFAGKIFRERRSFTYQIIPGKDLTGKQIMVFSFSESAGPVPLADKTGVPLTIEFIPELKTKPLTLVAGDKPESSSHRANRLYYRTPDVVNIKASFGNKGLNTSRKLIYQFGVVIQLPSNYIIGK
jgi:Domain of unknown function (DUF4831)